MLKNWDNKTKKRYLVFAALLFIVTFIISLALVFGFSKLGTRDLTVLQKIFLSLICAVVPTGSYTGFCLMFINKYELSSKQLLLIVIFCVPIVIYACIYGTVMLIPTIISCLMKNST